MRHGWLPILVVIVAGSLTVGAAGVWAGSCIAGGCHGQMVSLKFLHGPVAAEEAGAEGCVSCHEPTGSLCTARKAGAYKLKTQKDRLCMLCHERGTGTQHTRTRGQCLGCHSPHGSEESAKLLKAGG